MFIFIMSCLSANILSTAVMLTCKYSKHSCHAYLQTFWAQLSCLPANILSTAVMLIPANILSTAVMLPYKHSEPSCHDYLQTFWAQLSSLPANILSPADMLTCKHFEHSFQLEQGTNFLLPQFLVSKLSLLSRTKNMFKIDKSKSITLCTLFSLFFYPSFLLEGIVVLMQI